MHEDRMEMSYRGPRRYDGISERAGARKEEEREAKRDTFNFAH
jgi:hypothetical protein